MTCEQFCDPFQIDSLKLNVLTDSLIFLLFRVFCEIVKFNYEQNKYICTMLWYGRWPGSIDFVAEAHSIDSLEPTIDLSRNREMELMQKMFKYFFTKIFNCIIHTKYILISSKIFKVKRAGCQ